MNKCACPFPLLDIETIHKSVIVCKRCDGWWQIRISTADELERVRADMSADESYGGTD